MGNDCAKQNILKKTSVRTVHTMDSPINSNIPVILITGFGPFRSITKNPSWEVAKALKTYLEWSCPVHIVLEQMQVVYNDISCRIPELWMKYNPTLVIHLGVYAGAEAVLLERHACNEDYCMEDNNGTVPETECCIKGDAPRCLATKLPIDEVCARVKRRTNVPIAVSDDAGRFLCEFIYYQSLYVDPKRTLFMHVPALDATFTVENLAETIQLVIYELLKCVEPLPVVNQNDTYMLRTTNIKTEKTVAVKS